MKYIILICAVILSASTSCNAACSIIENGLTNSDKDTVVNKHNEVRGLISRGEVSGQPKGVNLKQMVYDEKLANLAQELANSCIFEHAVATDGRWQAVGQNLYISMSTAFRKGADWSQAIQSWFDEHKEYTFGGPVTAKNGHYTQVVWANSDHVGCGYNYFETHDYFSFRKLYVCNYGPAGNYVGQNPYQTE